MTTERSNFKPDEVIDVMSIDDLRTYAKLQRMDRAALEIAVTKLMEENSALKKDVRKYRDRCLEDERLLDE